MNTEGKFFSPTRKHFFYANLSQFEFFLPIFFSLETFFFNVNLSQIETFFSLSENHYFQCEFVPTGNIFLM